MSDEREEPIDEEEAIRRYEEKHGQIKKEPNKEPNHVAIYVLIGALLFSFFNIYNNNNIIERLEKANNEYRKLVEHYAFIQNKHGLQKMWHEARFHNSVKIEDLEDLKVLR